MKIKAFNIIYFCLILSVCHTQHLDYIHLSKNGEKNNFTTGIHIHQNENIILLKKNFFPDLDSEIIVFDPKAKEVKQTLKTSKGINADYEILLLTMFEGRILLFSVLNSIEEKNFLLFQEYNTIENRIIEIDRFEINKGLIDPNSIHLFNKEGQIDGIYAVSENDTLNHFYFSIDEQYRFDDNILFKTSKTNQTIKRHYWMEDIERYVLFIPNSYLMSTNVFDKDWNLLYVDDKLGIPKGCVPVGDSTIICTTSITDDIISGIWYGYEALMELNVGKDSVQITKESLLYQKADRSRINSLKIKLDNNNNILVAGEDLFYPETEFSNTVFIKSFTQDFEERWAIEYSDRNLLFSGYVVDSRNTMYLTGLSHNHYNNGELGSFLMTVKTPDYISTNTADYPDEYDIQLYPNPVGDYLYIESDPLIMGTNATIYNIMGQEIDALDIQSNRIDISHLITGAYILRLSIENQIINKRFVKM